MPLHKNRCISKIAITFITYSLLFGVSISASALDEAADTGAAEQMRSYQEQTSSSSDLSEALRNALDSTAMAKNSSDMFQSCIGANTDKLIHLVSHSYVPTEKK